MYNDDGLFISSDKGFIKVIINSRLIQETPETSFWRNLTKHNHMVINKYRKNDFTN